MIEVLKGITWVPVLGFIGGDCVHFSELSWHGNLLIPERDSHVMSRRWLQRQRSDGVADGWGSGSEAGHEWVDESGTQFRSEIL